ncbi:hypothetical protein [Nocardioides daphniae]|uniref:Ig-like domain repeat protein n=1 Tax=Nocardioides daphniae TaxID=402297 RepID=A0A4P7UBW4_9ACTN|nr:hypothetical protein [Nocardioides daphniae]QCC76805.1 hypothetical protein E2C04_05495 [Nocardioides daphniae]GGD16681.1 hypothetical protein GCM10007231_14540 [Nocardioides daphniae]
MSPAPHPRRTLRPAGLLAAGALLGALLSPTAATAATTAALDYTCLPEKSAVVTAPTAFEMPVSAEVTAQADGAAVNLAMTTGRPAIPGITSPITVTMRSSMAADVDGAAATLSGERQVTINPGTPTDLPALTGRVTTPSSTVALTPGALRVEFTYLVFTVVINCTPTSTPVVQVPVEGRNAPPSDPAPAPAVKPALKAGLTKKVQLVGKTPAKVVVTLAKGASTSQPRGTVKVTVGKRVVTTRKVTKGLSFRAALPRTLRPGRHKVTVTFTPAAGSKHLRATASVTLRVRR